jgi:hypothetical protein
MATPRPRPATLRHERGRTNLASLLNWWMRRAHFSHDQLARIADWGMGEVGCLSSPQISHLRNANVAKGASGKHLDAMAAANHAVWLWQTAGEEQAVKELGPYSSWGVQPEWLKDACWLESDRHQGAPLSFGEFCEVNAGRLELSYVTDVALSPTESTQLSHRLMELLNDLAPGATPVEGIRGVLAAYPLEDPERRARLQDLMLGGQWSRIELEEELYAVAMTVATLRGDPPGSYGPVQLHAELAAPRRRT